MRGDGRVTTSAERTPKRRARCVRCRKRPVEVPGHGAPHSQYCRDCGTDLFGAWRHFGD